MRHPLYHTWRGLRQRCKYSWHKCHKYYGARGIAVDPMWDHFWTFVFDMGSKPTAKHSIDRIDNNGPYAPWNCRWATQKEQIHNSRRTRFITFAGETLSILQWANKFNITRGAMAQRIRANGIEKTLGGLRT